MPINSTISVLLSRNRKQPARVRDGSDDSDRAWRNGGHLSAYARNAQASLTSSIWTSFGTWGRDWLYFSDDGANGFVSDVAGNFVGYRSVYRELVWHAYLPAQLDAGRKRRGRSSAP